MNLSLMKSVWKISRLIWAARTASLASRTPEVLGKELDFLTVDMREHIISYLVEHINTLHSHGYHLGLQML